MDFISNQEFQNKEMLKAIGITNVDELFQDIPKELILPKVTVDDGLSEYEGLKLMKAIANKNVFSEYQNYLGAGSYQHHVPAIVSSICSKAAFLTSYTPYQAEASQGNLQIIFEFQSAICALTGMDVSNASLYDGASACAEGLLMALRINKDRNKVLIAGNLHPHYKAVVKQYLISFQTEIVEIPFLQDGSLDLNAFETLIDDKTAAILLQYPNFFGSIDQVELFSKKAKETKALTILSANPMVYGLYKNAQELHCDIAVGDTQSFGLELQFGGPYVGYIACKEEYLRQLPGRIVGATLDREGKRGFVLTMQAREQHIRREKATSNICTNQALASLASLVGILWYGKKGIYELALTNYKRASYLKENLQKIPGVHAFSDQPIFNEFVVKFDLPMEKVLKFFRGRKIEPGLYLKPYFKTLDKHLLVAVTETKSLYDLDAYLECAKDLK